MKVTRIGDWTLEDRLGPGGPPLVVMFLTSEDPTNAPMCKEFRRVAAEHEGARFHEIDLFENPSLAQRYAITRTPTVLLFVDGAEVARHQGAFLNLEATVHRVLGAR